MFFSCWFLVVVLERAPAAGPAARNLALDAKATASETYQEFTAEKVNDGNAATRWSGVPGHNEGVWIQLEWERPVRLGEVLVRQFDRFVMELDVQVWDARTNDWRTLQHFGQRERRLPLAVVCRFEPQTTTRLRIGNITNGPSFTEIEAYEEHFAYGLATRLASDVNGNFLGIVTDSLGACPVADATVTLAGQAKTGTWEASARSDANGFFTIPMPVGLTGTVTARTTAAGQTVQAAWSATEFQYGLTPHGPDQLTEGITGPWRFQADPPADFWKPEFEDRDWPTIAVPAHWEMQGFHPPNGVGGYRTRFTVPFVDGRLKLLFDGVYSGAEVWVNGVRLADHEGGATPFECDITDAARAGENLLAVRVTEHTPTSDKLDQMSSYADFPLGGIMRSVRLMRVPAVHVAALALHTPFDARYENAAIAGRLAVLNESDRPFREGRLTFTLTDPAGRATPLADASLSIQANAWQRAEVDFHWPVSKPLAWDAEHPNLYTLTMELRAGQTLVQKLTQRVGFRQTDVRGPALLINGRPVKLRGTCHHDAHPLQGRAVTRDITFNDLLLIKRANLNAVRTSHYPPTPDLLDIADQIGLYVQDEAPFCWVGVSDDLNFTPRILQLTAELLARDRNHPCVFMWSLCNESEFGRGFERSHAWVRAADPTRPTAAATSAWLEIATLHNPIAVTRIDEQAGLDKPLLFDESFAPFQGIWGDADEIWLDPGLREYYAAPLAPIHERMMRSGVTHGSMIWCWADDIFCVPGRGVEYGRGATSRHFLEEPYAMPGRGLVGDAPWGLVDGWRRPKPEYWIVKKLHSPVRIAETPLALPASGAEVRVPVENQYDFTDLAELKIGWAIGDEQGALAAAVPPRAAGEIRCAPRRPPQAGDVLTLTFTDAGGALVDQFRLPFQAARGTKPPETAENAIPLRIAEESTLAGQATRIISGPFELAFDRRSGRLRRCVVFGQPLLMEFPAVHLLPTHAPLTPLPDRRSWRLKNLTIQKEGEDVRVKIAGAYAKLEGEYDWRITPAGEITLTSAFTYNGEDLWVRETGLRLAVPRACDLLQWDRQGEWNVYPEDHIGRPAGQTRAFIDHPPAVPPQWPWAQDNSPLGCNDFRGTKRNIRWTALRYPAGPGVLVLSDGQHHARAVVESERVALHINDWFGGTNAGLWEWEHNYGKGRLLRKGARLVTTLRLQWVRPETGGRESTP